MICGLVSLLRHHSQQFERGLSARFSGGWLATLLVVALLALRVVLPAAHVSLVHGEARLHADVVHGHDDPGEHEHAPGENHRHDSTTCGTCFELLIAKAADTTAAASLPIVGMVVDQIDLAPESRAVISVSLVDAPPRGPPLAA